MEIDSPSSGDAVSPRARIVQRLATNGVSEEYLEDLPLSLVSFIKNCDTRIPAVVSAILPTDAEVAEAIHDAKAGSKRALGNPTVRDLFRVSMNWLQWLIFKEEPFHALDNLEKMNVGQGGICGAVWGKDDVAFRCRTCEHDPTCAICVSCFQNGNHRDHDYSIIYTGGGCCDCGDESAWKPEGFCSRHKGAEMIQPLRDDIAQSVGPVLDVLFDCWRNKLMDAESVPNEKSEATDHATELRKVGNELTFAVVEMLLEFCGRSESLLSFISKRVIAAAGLLDALVRAEKFLSELVIKRLHELLLKLLGEPAFKYEFGKATVSYYPVFVQEAVKARKDNLLRRYSLLSFFSVQILTVPTLTMRLMKEVNVLKVLLDCVVDILFCCSGDDGLLQIDKFNNLYYTIMRLLGDIKFVLSHPEVAEYVRNDQQNIQSAWLRILSFVQGMNPQKRERGIHIEEENDNIHLPFHLCNMLFNISSLLAACAFSLTDGRALPESWKLNVEDEHGQRLTTVGSISEDSFACTSAGVKEWATLSSDFDTKPDGDTHLLVPGYVLLACECLKVIDRWLVIHNTLNVVPSGDNGDFNSKFLSFKRAMFKVGKGKYFGLGDEHKSADLQNVQCGEQIIQPGDCCKMDIDSSHDLIDGDNIMEEDFAIGSECFQVLSSPDWRDINYDVSSLPISMHIPYHRLLSFILKEALSKYCGESVMLNPGATTCEDPLKSLALPLGKILRGCRPYGFSSFVMEHPLQIRVFCAQVRAGMWRRNGQAGVVSCDLYRSDHLHTNPLELDLFLMQICAAFAPPDLYLRRILDRFGLLDYLSLDLQHSSEFEPVLAQEMLALIIQIIEERRYCGFTASENMRRELVRKLATGDATRSQLQKSLPRDLGELDLQDVLDSVAQYSNPTGMRQGIYTLRSSCWKDLDLYHPRWTPRDLQVAEERYLHACGVSAMTSQLPKWTGIYQPLIGVSRIATCKMVLEIIRAVLFYAVNDRTPQSRAPDGVLITALHLLSLGLEICTLQKEYGRLYQDGEVIPLLAFAGEEFMVGPGNAPDMHSLLSLLASLFRIDKNEKLSLVEVGKFNLSPLVENLLKKLGKLDTDCKRKLSELAPDVFNHLFQSSKDNDATRLDSASDAENHKAKARQRQAYIMEKMRAAQSKFLENVKADAGSGVDDLKAAEEQEEASIESNEICCLCHDSSSKTPVSFLVLLQKSRLLSFVNRGPPTWDQDLQSDKDDVHATANTITVSSESGLVESSKHAVPLSELKQLVRDALNEFVHGGFPVEVENFVNYLRKRIPDVRIASVPPIPGGPKERMADSLESLEEDLFHSIEKQMNVAACDSVAMNDGGIVPPEEGLLKDVDIDTVLLGKYLASLMRESVDIPYDSDDAGQQNDLAPHDGFGPTSCDGVHLSSCGHAVHQICLDRYLSSLLERHNRRMIFEGRHIVNLDQGEFLCPVCRRLVNSVLPACPRDSRSLWEQPVGTTRSSVSKEAASSFHHGLCLLKSAASVISRGEILKAVTTSSREVLPSVTPFSKKLCGMYFPAYGDAFSRAGRVSPSLIMWDTLKYSLISTEIAARCMIEANSTFDCCALDSELNSSGGFAFSLMLRLVQRTRSKSSFDVLLRLRSLMLFAASVCYGSGLDGSSASSSIQEGKILRILKHTDGDLMFPDIKFWNRASDPVLSRDPFCTLMWILFCLPYPFMSHVESLYSLVHIFYAVTITQGIIACCVRDGKKIAELSSNDCLVTDIAKLVAESGIAHQYFVCSDIDPSCNAMDSIRLLSLPFLRRCALICKLLKNSTSARLLGGDCSYSTTCNAAHGMGTSSFIDDLDEVSKLENMFGIPPLDTMLGDKQLRSQAPKWIHHFHEKFGGCNILSVLRLTPAVPFQLMRLPFVYQDLLQRYIKPRCPYCRDVQPEAALCLLCGRLCSASWKFCCRESACQSHAASCGAGTGVFLLIKNTTILLQRNGRRSLWPSPYLDAFGEEDLEIRRGKPLYLNNERHSTLNYMVASHGLDRSSKVLRNTTTGLFLIV